MPGTDYEDEESSPQEQPARTAGGLDRDRLKSLTEMIQVGDTEEGARALEQVVDLVRETTQNRIKQDFVTAKLRAENDAALARFAKKYPTLGEDTVLGDAAKSVVRRQVFDDLKAAGATDDMLTPIKDNLDRLVEVHGQARARGLNVRNPDDILNATGQELTRRFNIRPAQRNPHEYVADLRRDRGFDDKEQRAERGEAADYGRSGESDAFGSLEARRERVRAMREARGFPVNR